MDSYYNNKKKEEYCPYVPYSKPKKILLECGQHSQDAIFEIDDGKVQEKQSFVLDKLIIDTTCLYKPVVKIEFSSLIAFEAEDEEGKEHEVEVDLLFKLIRICKNGKGEKDYEVVQTWRYLKEIDVEDSIKELEVEISEPFTVTFCDKTCPGCCEYKMIVEGKDFEGEFEFLRVTKADLSALAQGLCDD
ncbi:MAG TPA: DUF4489 domain-containing protein [Clostridia bacterium]